MNRLGIGMDMSEVFLPRIKLETNNHTNYTQVLLGCIGMRYPLGLFHHLRYVLHILFLLVYLHNNFYIYPNMLARSTHDLSYLWRSSMSAGTLVPFMSELALPGDSFDINLNCEVLTLPTIGPILLLGLLFLLYFLVHLCLDI